MVASRTYIEVLDAYKSSMKLLLNAKVLYYTYDRGLLSFKSIFVYLC